MLNYNHTQGNPTLKTEKDQFLCWQEPKWTKMQCSQNKRTKSKGTELSLFIYSGWKALTAHWHRYEKLTWQGDPIVGQSSPLVSSVVFVKRCMCLARLSEGRDHALLLPTPISGAGRAWALPRPYTDTARGRIHHASTWVYVGLVKKRLPCRGPEINHHERKGCIMKLSTINFL